MLAPSTMVRRTALLLVFLTFFNNGHAASDEDFSNLAILSPTDNPDNMLKLRGEGGLGTPCFSDSACASGLYCFACPAAGASGFQPKCTRCRITPTSAFPKNTSLPFNKYAWLTTHNSFAIFGSPSESGVPIITFFNQEDSVLEQLNNGVRGLMLDMYDFRNDIWLCHSFRGVCYDFTAFRPASKTLAEIKTFLDSNPTEVITIFIEDYVTSPNGLTSLFSKAGLMKYWMPVAAMPSYGRLWPTLQTMIQRNHRLLVFTQNSTKEATEGVAFQWRYTTENQYGDDGMNNSSCLKRGGSPAMSDMSRSLIVQNYFPSNPNPINACKHNSDGLFKMLSTCYAASGNRWSNYIAVDFYKRSTGGGAFRALDRLNGQMECGCEDVTKTCTVSHVWRTFV
uniref:Phosphatidylinositol-specific phospholipase C X domain-containing protein n=2 Tax=Physcomitrium patens TaxID=3218 RepID=A0A2K1K6T3_PHYPA|nr:hypothetical protein PHYPA_011381 [Physcomitrium patens]